MKMEQTECFETSAMKFRRRGITRKKAYNIPNTAKVWNQEIRFDLCDPVYNKGQLSHAQFGRDFFF